MKKRLLVLVLALVMLTGCAGQAGIATPSPDTQEDTLQLVFDLPDLQDNMVSSDVFAQHKLTLINIWGTYCPPCIDEMPELNKLADTLAADDMLLLGLVVDGDQLAAAQRIQGEQALTYQSLRPDDAMYGILTSVVEVVPTTWFVDSRGTLLGMVEGANTAEGYMEIVREVLDDMADAGVKP